ncbi:MAG: lysophospholipid acyltransferase family protein [Sphingorhabdus sp.]
MYLIRSVLFAIIFYSGSVLFVVGAFIGTYGSTVFLRRSVHGWSRYHYFCARWLLGIHVVIDGELPIGAALVAMKHEAMFETIDMPRIFRLPAVVTKRELFDIPCWGTAAKAYGMIPVDRDAGASGLRAMLTLARKMQADDRPIVIFPEGTRVPHGQKPSLQAGFAGLYKLLGLPVVPIAVNSGVLTPKGKLWWKPGTITYKVGETIPTGLPRDEIEARVHAAINALNV